MQAKITYEAPHAGPGVVKIDTAGIPVTAFIRESTGRLNVELHTLAPQFYVGPGPVSTRTTIIRTATGESGYGYRTMGEIAPSEANFPYLNMFVPKGSMLDVKASANFAVIHQNDPITVQQAIDRGLLK